MSCVQLGFLTNVFGSTIAWHPSWGSVNLTLAPISFRAAMRNLQKMPHICFAGNSQALTTTKQEQHRREITFSEAEGTLDVFGMAIA